MYKKILVAMIATMFALAAVGAIAGGEEKVVEDQMVIALKGDDFELHETDISHLAVGDAETIVTDSGKTIDLLRTEDGVEIYVDGELLDIGGGHGELHEAHEVHESHKMVYKTIEIECESEDDC